MNNNKKKKHFAKDIILLENVEETANRIIEKLRTDVHHVLKRQGGIVGVSGGIDSSVCLALTVKALGADKVIGLMLPEKDSSPESELLAMELAGQFGVRVYKEDITAVLKGYRCYERRDEAIKRACPEYDPHTCKMKIGIKQRGLYSNLPPLFSLTVIFPDGRELEKTLNAENYLQIVASSNLKQRTRMSMLYYYAEKYHYAVIGTPNKHEKEQGFFVKYGDGAADVMPINELYKTQVYQLAEFLGLPKEIIDRTPTTDTYTAEQTQEEFFFQLPFDLLDLYWYGFENRYSASEVATVMNENIYRVQAIYANFKRKIESTNYLRMAPIRDY